MSSAAPDVAPALTISVTEASSSVPAPPDVAASPRVDARDAVSSPLSPRGILKTATSRALKRASVHATMASVLISNSSSRIVFKILVLGGPGVGKSSLLRAAALGPTGDQLTAGEQARYTPSLAPHFTTLHAAWLRDRPVFAQLWEVPFSLLVADAAARAADSVSASDGRRFPGSRSLDIAFADAHAAVVLFDARDAGPPLGVKYSVFDASGAAVEAEWRGNSLAAADLARDVLAVRVCAPLAAKGLALPLYLLAHKGDHPAALSTALQHQRQQRSASLSTMAAAAAEDASAGGGGGDTREANAPRLSGVFEDFFGRSAAASVVDAPSDLSARAGGAVGEGGGAEAWGATSASIPVSGFGVPYLRFSHGGECACASRARALSSRARALALSCYRSHSVNVRGADHPPPSPKFSYNLTRQGLSPPRTCPRIAQPQGIVGGRGRAPSHRSQTRLRRPRNYCAKRGRG